MHARLYWRMRRYCLLCACWRSAAAGAAAVLLQYIMVQLKGGCALVVIIYGFLLANLGKHQDKKR